MSQSADINSHFNATGTASVNLENGLFKVRPYGDTVIFGELFGWSSTKKVDETAIGIQLDTEKGEINIINMNMP